MDREFMRQYYTNNYEELETVVLDEIEKKQYEESCKIHSDLEKQLEEMCGGLDTALWTLYENCMEEYSMREGILHEAFYLQGASDRERMLQ